MFCNFETPKWAARNSWLRVTILLVALVFHEILKVFEDILDALLFDLRWCRLRLLALLIYDCQYRHLQYAAR